MGFCGRFFIALLAVCIVRGAWANCECDDGMCSANEYCNRIIEVDHGHAVVSSTECTPCPMGSVPANGCYSCEASNVCYGYDDLCPTGIATGAKCKKNTTTCPSPCLYYEICYPWLPATQMEELVIGACHIENNTCYSNTRACNKFAMDQVEVGWTCDQAVQQGNAEWTSSENAWDTKNCTCSVVDRDIVHDVGGVAADSHCIAANSDFNVTDADRYTTTSVNDYVRYSFKRRFCRQCEPGYLPFIDSSPSNGIILRPENGPDGNWGAYKCQDMVAAPDYADGCMINFGLPTGGDARDACRKPCPDGFATEGPGATSVEECRYDGYTTYTDSTGTFYIGSLDDCT